MSEETLQYPAKIAEEIGISPNRINAMKRQGCRFFGRKTSVRWVRAFVNQTMGVESSPALPAHPPRSVENKSYG